MKLKILYIVSTLRDTGPTNQLFGIVSNLDKEIFEPFIMTLAKEPVNSKKELFVNAGIHVESIGLSRIKFLFVGKRKLRKRILEIRPNLIHTNGIRSDCVVNKLKIEIPVCSTIRAYIYEDYKALYGKTVGTVMEIMHTKAIKTMKYPICCSKSIAKKYAEQLNIDFCVIQNGVDIKRYSSKDKNRATEARQKLGLPLNKIVCVVVGALIDRKDPLTIVKAVEQIKDKSDFLFLFIGDGVLREEMEKHRSEYIYILGHKPNVSEFLQASDFFISASKSEGLPNSVLEAGACGIPMILSNISQHREIFETKMDGIAFFEVGDISKLSELIINFGENCRQYSSQYISEYIKGKFDSKIMSRNYQDFYLRCIYSKENK